MSRAYMSRVSWLDSTSFCFNRRHFNPQGLSAKDEWDFAHIGMSNHPFIKGNCTFHFSVTSESVVFRLSFATCPLLMHLNFAQILIMKVSGDGARPPTRLY